MNPTDRYKFLHPRRARASNVLGVIRHRCRKYEIECDIDLEWLHGKFVEGKCEITGLPFDFNPPKKKGAKPPFTPSVDRIDPTKGYTKENCQVICWAVNRAKGEFGYDLLYHWAKPFVKAYEEWVESEI